MARPRSIVRGRPVSATSTAPSSLCGILYVRAKSQPVPRGMTAISTSVCDLVHGSVATDDHEQLRAVVGSLAGELAELAGAL